MSIYSPRERQRIMLRAKVTLGRVNKNDAGERFDFMSQCVDDLSSDTDEDNAQQICELLWDEQGGD